MVAASQDLWSGQSHGWRYLAQRLNRDGTQGTWLDNELPLQEVTVTDVVSGPPQLSAKIAPELTRLIASDGSPLLDEWGTIIYAEADGVIRAGTIFVRSQEDGPVYSVEGSGFSGYPKGMAYEGVQQFRNVDPIDVVRHIWDHVQAGQHSDIGLTIDRVTHSPERVGQATTDSAGTTQDSPYELSWWSNDDLGGDIDTLAQNTPFDYHERHVWNSTHTEVLHLLDFGYPLIGRRRADLRFVLGENIQVMPTVERDGENYANHVRVLGAGEGSAMIRAEARTDDGRVRRTLTLDAKDITSTVLAQRVARNELALRSALGTITQVVVRNSPGTPVGAWGVGDEIRIIADVDWESVDLWFQVVSITYTPDQPDLVTMSLARAGGGPTVATSVDRLAVQIAALQQQVRHLGRRPQLPNSSIDTGAVTVTTPDVNGDPQTTAIIGNQYDGTSGSVTVGGPYPPTPTQPDLLAVVGGVQVTWDGHFADPQPGFTSPVVAPLDFNYVRVEVSDDPGFPGLPKTADIKSAQGGTVTLSWSPVNTPVYARLITWSTPGKASVPSAFSGPVDSGPVGLQDLGFDLADYAGGTTIYYGSSTPTAPPEGFTPGDMWLQDTGTTGPDGQPLYLLYRWDGIEWLLLQDQGIADSLAQAIAAQDTADQAGLTAADAQTLADTANTTAGNALTIANQKITTWYQTTAPASGRTTGDLWVDTDDGNKLYRWNGSAWLTVQDTLMQAAYTAAGDAQATADGKIVTFYQTTAPTATSTGDLWVDTDDGNHLYRWSGAAWTTVKDTNIAQALVDAATAQATANTKITTFYQASPPASGMSTGDFWIDTDDGNKLYRWSGSWVNVQDTNIQTALVAAGDAQATADGKVVTFAQASAPPPHRWGTCGWTPTTATSCTGGAAAVGRWSGTQASRRPWPTPQPHWSRRRTPPPPSTAR